jgi:hypothetical protein
VNFFDQEAGAEVDFTGTGVGIPTCTTIVYVALFAQIASEDDKH